MIDSIDTLKLLHGVQNDLLDAFGLSDDSELDRVINKAMQKLDILLDDALAKSQVAA